jgi:hypothetical protein
MFAWHNSELGGPHVADDKKSAAGMQIWGSVNNWNYYVLEGQVMTMSSESKNELSRRRF